MTSGHCIFHWHTTQHIFCKQRVYTLSVICRRHALRLGFPPWPEATQAEKFHFLPSWNSKGEWCHQLGTLRGLNGSLIALTGCFLLCGLFWMNFKSLTDSRKHIHSIFFSGKLREPAHCSPWPLWCEELRACRRTLCCLKFCISHNLMSSLCDKLEVLLWLLKQ